MGGPVGHQIGPIENSPGGYRSSPNPQMTMLWVIWPYWVFGGALQICLSGISLKMSSKMEFRHVDLRSFGKWWKRVQNMYLPSKFICWRLLSKVLLDLAAHSKLSHFSQWRKLNVPLSYLSAISLASYSSLFIIICHQGCTNCGSLAAWLRGIGERMRKWGIGESFTLYISSFSLYFLPLYPFPDQKLSHFFPKC